MFIALTRAQIRLHNPPLTEARSWQTTITSVTTARPANAAGRRFGLLLHANLLMFLRNRMALFWNIVFPIGLMLLFGAVFGEQAGAIPYLTSGMVVLSLMSNGMIGNASRAGRSWRQQGILRRIQTTPLAGVAVAAQPHRRTGRLDGRPGVLAGRHQCARLRSAI